MSREQEAVQEQPAAKPARKPVALWAALAIALVLIVLPGLFTGPLFAPFVFLWAIFALPLSFRAKYAPIRNQRLRNLALYLFAAILVGVVHSYRIDGAQARGQALVTALKAYRAENQRYPAGLNELAPKYIGSIPAAAYGSYYYSAAANAEPLFFFVTLPPFGRRAYCFGETGNCGLNIANPSAKDEWYDFD